MLTTFFQYYLFGLVVLSIICFTPKPEENSSTLENIVFLIFWPIFVAINFFAILVSIFSPEKLPSPADNTEFNDEG
jgi:hypothetical protein